MFGNVLHHRKAHDHNIDVSNMSGAAMICKANVNAIVNVACAVSIRLTGCIIRTKSRCTRAHVGLTF